MKNFRVYFRFLKIFLDSATSPFVGKILNLPYFFNFPVKQKKILKIFSIFFSLFLVAELEKIIEINTRKKYRYSKISDTAETK